MSAPFKNRRELILHLNKTKAELAVEVGVREGYFSKFILDNTSVKKLYAIDPWERNAELGGTIDEILEKNLNNNVFFIRFFLVKGYSPFAAEMFEDSSLDFVYIDGLHDYESVKADIAGFYRKVKTGGIIAGHDYHLGDWPGVYNSVNEFISENNLEINITGTDSPDYDIEHDGWKPSWWAVKK
jgi:SAM-dependent methyltransferase